MVDLVLDRVLTSTQLEKIFVQVCEARTLGKIFYLSGRERKKVGYTLYRSSSNGTGDRRWAAGWGREAGWRNGVKPDGETAGDRLAVQKRSDAQHV